MASIKLKGDTSGEITIQAPAVAGTTTLNLPATSSTLATQNALGVRNLIINGDMRIDQRNAGASVTSASNVYLTDRWQLQIFGTTNTPSFQQVTDAPTGFQYSLKATSNGSETLSSNNAVTPRQRIEGYNSAHLLYGTANAKTVTISFWVKSSLTGTWNISITNSSFNRSYVAEYTINSANTWEYKTVTILGDTTGTWSTDNSTGLVLMFPVDAGTDLDGTVNTWLAGSYRTSSGTNRLLGTSGATWQITGVQLEISDGEATPFEHRPYDMELARCQRYYETSYNQGTALGTVTQDGAEMWLANRNPGAPHHYLKFRTVKRANPGITIYNPTTGATGSFRNLDAGTNPSSVTSRIGHKGSTLYTGTSTGLGQFMQFHYTADAEL